jgi:O-succinylbenzoic acid--CoA ligase
MDFPSTGFRHAQPGGSGHRPSTDWLASRAQASPAHLALIHGERSWSYAELDTRAETLAGRLWALGIRPGQHVAALLPNCPDFIVLIHALIRLGALLVPLNLRLTADELRWQVEESDSNWLVYNKSTSAQAVDAAGAHCRSLDLDDLPEPQPFPLPPFDLSSPLAILFTSGTTGRPKGAVQTLDNHFWNALASAFRLGTLPDDRWLLTIPLYHVGGLAIPLRCCLYGTAVVVPAAESVAPAGRGTFGVAPWRHFGQMSSM